MKKFIALLMAGCMLLGVTGICEGVDFASATDEELVRMYVQLQEEIYSRGIVPRPEIDEEGQVVTGELARAPFCAGKYVTGKDIKAGDYIISCPEYVGGTILVFSTEEAYETFIKDPWADESLALCKCYYEADDEQSVYISLAEGDILYLMDFDGDAVISQVEMFWRP